MIEISLYQFKILMTKFIISLQLNEADFVLK